MTPSRLGAVRIVPVGEVKPYPANPRKVPQKAIEQTAASIREFGWQQPIVVDAGMVIVAGHTRFAAAKHLGETEVPVIVADQLTPEQVRAFRIADNRTHDYTSWDHPLLMSEMDGLDEDFAEVLDLADWQNIIGQFESARDEAILDFDPEVSASLADTYRLSVTFTSKEEAEQAAPGILELPGVVNVAYSGR
jgi:hypothetical protein